jgi:hypothetical protein
MPHLKNGRFIKNKPKIKMDNAIENNHEIKGENAASNVIGGVIPSNKDNINSHKIIRGGAMLNMVNVGYKPEKKTKLNSLKISL